MEFLLVDLGAALAALLGYRLLSVLARRGKQVRARHTPTPDLLRANPRRLINWW
jgi:hypothetical protein